MISAIEPSLGSVHREVENVNPAVTFVGGVFAAVLVMWVICAVFLLGRDRRKSREERQLKLIQDLIEACTERTLDGKKPTSCWKPYKLSQGTWGYILTWQGPIYEIKLSLYRECVLTENIVRNVAVLTRTDRAEEAPKIPPWTFYDLTSWKIGDALDMLLDAAEETASEPEPASTEAA